MQVLLLAEKGENPAVWVWIHSSPLLVNLVVCSQTGYTALGAGACLRKEEAAAKVEGGGNENCPGYFSSQDVLCLFVLSCLWLVPSADADTKQGWGLGWRTGPFPAIESSISSIAGMRKIWRKYLDFTRGKIPGSTQLNLFFF